MRYVHVRNLYLPRGQQDQEGLGSSVRFCPFVSVLHDWSLWSIVQRQRDCLILIGKRAVQIRHEPIPVGGSSHKRHDSGQVLFQLWVSKAGREPLKANTFVPITGSLDLKMGEMRGTEADAEILSSVNLEQFYQATTDAERIDAVQQLLEYRGVSVGDTAESALYDALSDFGPMKLLINLTMKEAQPIGELGKEIFPVVVVGKGNSALTTLMALGSVARTESNTPGLLPCRIHNFFRGLPGLWVCMDPDCSEVDEEAGGGICGKMYGQPREQCKCGARVLDRDSPDGSSQSPKKVTQ